MAGRAVRAARSGRAETGINRGPVADTWKRYTAEMQGGRDWAVTTATHRIAKTGEKGCQTAQPHTQIVWSQYPAGNGVHLTRCVYT